MWGVFTLSSGFLNLWKNIIFFMYFLPPEKDGAFLKSGEGKVDVDIWVKGKLSVIYCVARSRRVPTESYQTISKVNIVGRCCQAFVSGCCAQMLCSCFATKWSTLTSVLLAFWFYSFKTFTEFFSYMSSIFLGSLYEKHCADCTNVLRVV